MPRRSFNLHLDIECPCCDACEIASQAHLQASMWRRAYLGRLHREIQDDVLPMPNIQAENWVRSSAFFCLSIFAVFICIILVQLNR